MPKIYQIINQMSILWDIFIYHILFYEKDYTVIMFSREIEKIDDDRIHPYCVMNGILYVSKSTLDKIQPGSNGRSGFLVLQDGCLENEGGDVTNNELLKLRNKIHVI